MDLPLTDETKKAILATAETDETFKSIAGRLSVHISDVCEVLNPEDRYKKLILLKDGTVRKVILNFIDS
jgi:hypothetical protein